MAEARAGAWLHARSSASAVLDEPTAALDAETEHALFERYAAAARATAREPPRPHHPSSFPTVVSTVRMADLIVVLDGARLVEVGTTMS